MTRYDDAVLAEHLDRFLDEQTPPAGLPTTDVATVQALSRSAEQMEPDAAFVTRLEQRLRALPRPEEAGSRHTRSGPAWWQRLFPSVGRLAWAGLFALLLIVLVVALRTLSANSVPADEPEPVTGPSPTATTEAAANVPLPTATATQPGEAANIPPPTATATPTPPIATVPPEPVANVVSVAEALGVRWEGWSPDGRFALYRTHTVADLEINPQYTPGDFHVYDTVRPDIRCTEVVDHYELRPHLWLNDRELLYVTDNGEVVVWPVCADERASWTERFPEIPLTISAASPDRTRFLFRGESRYWLFDTSTLQATPVEGLTDEEVGDPISASPELPVVQWNDASWSPEGSRVAISFTTGDTVVVDGATGALVQRIEALSNGGLGGPPPPVWLSETELLIPNTRQGSLLVTVGDEPRFVEELFFGKEPVPTTLDGVQHQTWVAVDEASGAYHLVHVTLGDGGGALGAPPPSAQLYHSETGEVEEIGAPADNATSFLPRAFSQDGRFLLLDLTLIPENTIQAWFRPLDPPDTQSQLVTGVEWQLPLLSSDGQWVAAQGEAGVAVIDTMTGAVARLWELPGAQPVSWSPDGESLIVTQPATDDNGLQRLFLLPLSPSDAVTEGEPAISDGTYTCDPLNGLSWITPAGWYPPLPPPPEAIGGASIVTNHPEPIDPGSTPTPETITIQLFVEEVGTMLLEEVLEEVRAQVAYGPPTLSLTQREAVTIAGLSGYWFEGSPEGESGVRIVLLDGGEGRIVHIAIRPAFSNYMDEALAMLETLEVGPCD